MSITNATVKGWYRVRTRRPDTDVTFWTSGSRSEAGDKDVTVGFRALEGDDLDACRKLRVTMSPQAARRLAQLLHDAADFVEKKKWPCLDAPERARREVSE